MTLSRLSSDRFHSFLFLFFVFIFPHKQSMLDFASVEDMKKGMCAVLTEC